MNRHCPDCSRRHGREQQPPQRTRRRRPWVGAGATAVLQLLLALLARAGAFVLPLRAGGGGTSRLPLPLPALQQSRLRLQGQQQPSPSPHGRRARAPVQMIFNALRPPKAGLPPPEKTPNKAATKAEATIVLLAGFEAFNVQLYKKAAMRLTAVCPRLRVVVFTDRDIAERPDAVAAELAQADVFFGSLIFDYDQVSWLTERIEHIPARFVFESALELMGKTRVGSFTMASPSGEGQQQGPPPAVKALLSKFGSKKEEDRLKGYLSFLKVWDMAVSGCVWIGAIDDQIQPTKQRFLLRK